MFTKRESSDTSSHSSIVHRLLVILCQPALALGKTNRQHNPLLPFTFALLPLYFCLLLLSSCNLINPAEGVPAYLYIHNPSVVTNVVEEGAATQKISDAWVFLDDETYGVYQLPAWVPVLAEGSTEIKLLAGIKVNGSSANRQDYPFYSTHTLNVDLTAAQTDTVSPVFEYEANTIFALLEDFETGNEFDKMERVSGLPDIAFGQAAGAIFLGDTLSSRSVRSLTNFDLPDDGVQVFLEMDYKNDNTFLVGVAGFLNSGEAVGQFHCAVSILYGDGGIMIFQNTFGK